MNKKIHFHNGAVADWLEDEYNEREDCPMVLYKRRKYRLRGHFLTSECYIKVGRHTFFMQGSIELIDGREVKLFWQDWEEYEPLQKHVMDIFKRQPDCVSLAFGVQDYLFFTQEIEGFVTLSPEGGRKVFETVDQVRNYLNENHDRYDVGPKFYEN